MSDTHDTTPQADTPPVMVAVGADLIREAIARLEDGAEHARILACEGCWSSAEIERIEGDVDSMGATAKALAGALPGGGA